MIDMKDEQKLKDEIDNLFNFIAKTDSSEFKSEVFSMIAALHWALGKELASPTRRIEILYADGWKEE